jgi:hypothetical protein
LFTDFVAVAGGRNVYVQCAGSGSPTIILESGDETDHSQWGLVAPSLAERTRTCSYDRLGIGASDKPTGCRQLKDLNGDLEALLRATGEDGPYVVVGTSGGGFLMAGFAYAHPHDVKGMAFVETPHAIIAKEAPPELLQELKCDSPMNEERRDYVAVENQAWTNREPIGDIPLVVISNDYGDSYENEEQRTNVKDQKGWFKLSPQARQVVVTSGHNVPENDSDQGDPPSAGGYSEAVTLATSVHFYRRRCAAVKPREGCSASRCPELSKGFDELRPQTESTAERRRVTVTFSDLSGFTAMTEQLEAEDVRDVMDAIFDKAAHIIDRYGGTHRQPPRRRRDGGVRRPGGIRG